MIGNKSIFLGDSHRVMLFNPWIQSMSVSAMTRTSTPLPSYAAGLATSPAIALIDSTALP